MLERYVFYSHTEAIVNNRFHIGIDLSQHPAFVKSRLCRDLCNLLTDPNEAKNAPSKIKIKSRTRFPRRFDDKSDEKERRSRFLLFEIKSETTFTDSKRLS